MHKQIVALLAFGLSFAVCQTNFTISKQNLTDPSQDLPEFPCDYAASGEVRTKQCQLTSLSVGSLCPQQHMLWHSVCIQRIPQIWGLHSFPFIHALCHIST